MAAPNEGGGDEKGMRVDPNVTLEGGGTLPEEGGGTPTSPRPPDAPPGAPPRDDTEQGSDPG